MRLRKLLIVGLLLGSVVIGCSEDQVTTTGPQNPNPVPTDTVTLGSIMAVVALDSIPWEGATVDIGTASGMTASDGTLTFSDITEGLYQEYRGRYKECIRMLNGLEKTLERKVPERERRWQVAEESVVYGADNENCPQGWPRHQ